MYAAFSREIKINTVVLLAACCAVLLAACSRNPERRLAATLPGLDETMIHQLATGDDSTLAEHARATGVYPLRHAGAAMAAALQVESAKKFEAARGLLLPALERLGRVYESEFNSVRFSREAGFWRGATPARSAQLAQLHNRSLELLADTTITTSRRIVEFKNLHGRYKQAGYLPGVATCEHEIGNLYAQTDKSQQKLWYRRALEDAGTAGMTPMICQILGTLGHEAAVAGSTDSMFYYWDLSRRVAERHKLPDYSARIYEFYARHYETEGRLALAHDLLLEAQEKCRSLMGGYRELRFVVKLIDFYNDLECWEVAGRLLPRAALLEQKVPETIPAGTYAQSLRARLARARYLTATGSVDEAKQIIDDLKPLARQQLQRDQYPRLLFTWSEQLLDAGRDDLARDPVEEGLARSKQVNFPYLIPKFHLLRAELFLRRQDFSSALAAVADYERTTADWPAKYEREWIRRDVIVTRALLGLGDADSAAVTLAGGLDRLEQLIAAREPSTHAYLWLEKNDDLRELLRERTRGDPLSAYGAELYWRQLYRRLGVPRSAGAASKTGTAGDAAPGARMRALAADALERLSRRGGTHVLYAVGTNRVVRFTAGPAGVRRVTLPVPLAELERIVTASWRQLSAPREDRLSPVEPELARLLRALALQLLPPEILDDKTSKPPPLYVSAEGFLAALPFETLNLARDGSYVPLLSARDVVYLRRVRPGGAPRRPAPAGGLVVSNPALSRETRRRMSLPEPLPGASREAAAVAALVDGAVVLDGADATKSSVLAAWENEPLLYFAAHFLSNPEIPFLTLLPLADPGDAAPPDAAFIDIGDVRSADLGGCETVVLSGCATGAPYLSRRVTGPSFGDAVCDAGAHQVIQTFWTVGDDDAQHQLEPFFELWHPGDGPAASALNRIRRNQLSTRDGQTHPYFWAAFHIKLSHL